MELGAAEAGLLLELGASAVLAAGGAGRQGAALAALTLLLVPRTCTERDARRAEVAAWRAESSGPLVLVGRAEATRREPDGRAAYLFRVGARALPGETLVDRSGWVRLSWWPTSERAPGARSPGAKSAVGAPEPSERREGPPVGREIEVWGRFRPYGGPENPGTLDWGALAGGPRVRGSLAVTAWRQRPGRSPLLQGLRERLSARIESLFPPLSGGFMQAALFGDRERLDPRLREVFSRTGTGHIIAISGMNVAILAAIGWAVLTPLVPRLGRRRQALAVALLFYVPLGGSSPSVARAAFMAAGLLAAQGMARRVLLPNALGAAGLPLLWLQPGSLLDPSFQLSFVAVLGLSLLPELPGRRLVELARSRLPGGRPAGAAEQAHARVAASPLAGAALATAAGALDLAAVTLVSLASTLPFTLAYFRHLPLLSLPANLVVVPALGALMAGGFAALLGSLVSESLGRLYARACDLLLAFVFRALEVCAAPGWVWPSLAGPRTLLAAMGLCASALSLAALRLPRTRAPAAAGALLLLLSLPAALGPRTGRDLEVSVLSVGQGDAIALLLPGGDALLVDGGPREAGGAIAAFLQERGVRRLRRVFATHPDADHTGGLGAVLEQVSADSAHDGGQWGPGSPYRRFLGASYSAGSGYRPLVAGERLRQGPVTLDVLWPPAGYAGRDPYWEGFATNDASLVILIGYGRFRMLLTGDASGEVERRVARAYGDSLRSDVLKVAHHGSRFSSATELVRAVRAPVALVSVGRENRYGHPSPEALDRLGRATRIWRTDREGALLLRTDGTRYEILGFASGRRESGVLPLRP